MELDAADADAVDIISPVKASTMFL